MNRRTFLNRSILTSTFLGSVGASNVFSLANNIGKNDRMFIGTPVLPEFLYENGISKSLDKMQERAGINTIMTFSHDHVFRQYHKNFDTKVSRKGEPLTNVWVRTDAKYYANPALMGRTDECKYADRDILDDLHKEAKPRGLKVYARILEPYVVTGAIPGFEKWREVDAYGKETDHVCFNHPDYIQYVQSVVTDLVHNHPNLDGFKYGQERGGPLLSSLGKGQVGKCFCEHCNKKAKEIGLDIENARNGLIAIHEYAQKIMSDQPPVDGNFVTFIKLLTEYPMLLPWEKFWMDSRDNHKRLIYKWIKEINPNMQVGWHIDHGMTWDLITRATWDYAQMGAYSDWLSVAVYFDSMGRRSMGHFNRNYKDILFGDADENVAYDMYLSMLGYDPKKQPPLSAHKAHDTSFSSDYVNAECNRAVKAVNGGALVYARPGFDMPGYDCNVSPEEVSRATKSALDAGVNGLWCGREWDELRPENAIAFGKAIQEWKKNNSIK